MSETNTKQNIFIKNANIISTCSNIRNAIDRVYVSMAERNTIVKNVLINSKFR